MISAARLVSKPVQAAAEWPKDMSTSELQGNRIAFIGGLPLPDPSTNGLKPVTAAKRRPSDSRSAEYRTAADEVPMIPSHLNFARPQKKIKPAPSPSPLQAESDEQALKCIQQSLQSGRLAKAELVEVMKAKVTMAAQLDALQAENNNIKTANERLSTEKQSSELKTAETLHNHQKLVVELDTAHTATKDLETRITAITSERANFAQKLTTSTTENRRLMTENAALRIHIATMPIAQLESEKSVLQAKNGDLEEQVERLEKAVKDAVGGFEAYKKRVLALGNEM